MNKRVLLTEKSDPLNYIKESGVNKDGKHYLGKLAGPAAKWTTPTRNGRRYPYELWVGVENSEDFKEGMETLTIFGEADHPETRIDTSIKEIAIVMTKFEIRKDEGIVYAEFDILDTPNGRILKELLDYGSKIGVSSRGLGDEIVVDGETIIDPETYVFYGFDAVVMPAVIEARPTVIESNSSKRGKGLLESFNREINDATSIVELKSIEKLAESVNMPNLDSIKESIKNKISSYNDGENISLLKSDLESSVKENNDLKSNVSKLESKLAAKDIRLKNLKNTLSKLSESSSNLRTLLMQVKLELKERDEAIFEGIDKIDELTDALETTKVCYERKIKAMSKNYEVSRANNSNKIDKMHREIESLKKSYDNKISDIMNKHNGELSSLKRHNLQLKESVSNLSKQLEFTKSSKILSEKNSSKAESVLKEKLDKSQKYSKTATDKYLKIKCLESNIDIETAKYHLPKNYSIEDIDRVVSKLADRKLRISKVPYVIQPNSITINEMNSSMSSEESQTIAFLEAINKH